MISRNDVLDSLREIVKGREDHVYKSPVDADGAAVNSTSDGSPSCLVGHAVYRLDPELFQQIHEYEWQLDEFDRVIVQEFSAERFRAPFDTEAVEVLKSVQSDQDAGVPWGLIGALQFETVAA